MQDNSENKFNSCKLRTVQTIAWKNIDNCDKRW